MDLSQAQLAAPEVILTKASLVGGVRVWVPAGIRVDVSGFSLVGGVCIRRGGAPQQSRAYRRSDRQSRRNQFTCF